MNGDVGKYQEKYEETGFHVFAAVFQERMVVRRESILSIDTAGDILLHFAHSVINAWALFLGV
jgi:hypothetical protein